MCGLIAMVMYTPYDLMGPEMGWWVWKEHLTTEPRWMGVRARRPCGFSAFHAGLCWLLEKVFSTKLRRVRSSHPLRAWVALATLVLGPGTWRFLPITACGFLGLTDGVILVLFIIMGVLIAPAGPAPHPNLGPADSWSFDPRGHGFFLFVCVLGDLPAADRRGGDPALRASAFSLCSGVSCCACPAAHALAACARPIEPSRSHPPSQGPGDVVDVHHGVSVPDPYRWLEDSKSRGPPGIAAASRPDAAAPRFAAARTSASRIGSRVYGTTSGSAPRRVVGEHYYYRYNSGLQQHSVLMVSVTGVEESVFCSARGLLEGRPGLARVVRAK